MNALLMQMPRTTQKGRLCRMRVSAPAALAEASAAAPRHTCRLPASHVICSRMLAVVSAIFRVKC